MNNLNNYLIETIYIIYYYLGLAVCGWGNFKKVF